MVCIRINREQDDITKTGAISLRFENSFPNVFELFANRMTQWQLRPHRQHCLGKFPIFNTLKNSNKQQQQQQTHIHTHTHTCI